jgi:hypothetical protein
VKWADSVLPQHSYRTTDGVRNLNRLISLTQKNFFCAALSFALVTIGPQACAQEDDDLDTEIDWEARFTQIVDIRTEALENYIRNDKNGFDKLILTRVNCQTPKDKQAKKYEVLWYRKGDPVGVRRLGGLAFQAPQKIALHVMHASLPAGEDEIKASANACLRLFLDLNAKTMSPSALVVPKQSFNSFVQRMNQLNFYSAEEPEPNVPVHTSIILSVESEPPGLRQLLFYTGRGF